MGIITKNYLLKEINRDYLDIIAKDYDIDEDKAEFVIKGFSLAPHEMQFNDGECSSVDILSTKSIDRDGEIVDPNGVVLDIFRKHPVCVWCHDYKQLPIGKSVWIKSNGEAIVAKTIYAVKSNPLAKQIYEYRKEGFPLGKSLGFVPVDWEDYNPKTTKGLRRKYNKVILLEYSDVPLPSNPDAIQLAVSKGLIKPDYPKMFYFRDVLNTRNLEEKEDMKEKEMEEKGIEVYREFCPVCNETWEMEVSDDEYTCKRCGSKRKKDAIVEKIKKREDVNPESGIEKYGDVEFADEKNKKYPIDTEAHVRAALAYWGMPKNREKYSKEDQKVITARIRAAARKFGIEVKEEEEEEKKKKEFSDNEVVHKVFFEANPSVSDIIAAIESYLVKRGDNQKKPATSAEQVNFYWVVDLYPINYPSGGVVYCVSNDEDKKTYYYSADYTYSKDGEVMLENIAEVEMSYVNVTKSLFEVRRLLETQVDKLKFENKSLVEQIDEMHNEIDYLSNEIVTVKEGKMLSSKNRQLILDCINALQSILDAASEKSEELIDIVESEKENKTMKSEEDLLPFTKEEIEEITKKTISLIKFPELNVAEIVNKVEAKLRGRAVI